MLQVLIFVLLRQLHQDSLFLDLVIIAIALLASWLLTVPHGVSEISTRVMLWLLGLFPQFVILATLLHLLG